MTNAKPMLTSAFIPRVALVNHAKTLREIGNATTLTNANPTMETAIARTTPNATTVTTTTRVIAALTSNPKTAMWTLMNVSTIMVTAKPEPLAKTPTVASTASTLTSASVPLVFTAEPALTVTTCTLVIAQPRERPLLS
jgi:hypothetical protein